MSTAPLWLRAVTRRLGFPAPRHATVRRDRDLGATTADGTVLLADRWYPQGVERPPLVLVRLPYGRRGVIGLVYGRALAHQGFQVVVQSCRGTAGSGGSFDRPFVAEVEDGRDTVAWLREQSFYPGGFATLGGSYFGYTQLALAPFAGDELLAAVLQVTPTDLHGIAWPDGSFAHGVATRWAAQASDDPAAALRHLLRAAALEKGLRAAGTSAPLGTTYRAATKGERVGYLEGWLEHPGAEDPYWQATDLTESLDALRCPVLVQAGWYDLFLEQGVEQYRRLVRNGVDVRLSVGDFAHSGTATKVMGEATAFLHEVLHGEPRATSAPVRLLELGTGTWTEHSDWPEPRTEQRLLLGAGRLTEQSPGGPASTSYAYDPADPTPQAGGMTLDAKSGPRDNREREARPDVVVFDTAALTAPLRLRGQAGVQLTFTSDRPETCLFVRLCQVSADGRSTNLTDRMVSLRATAAVAPGRWAVDVVLPPVAAALPTGSRLRLQLSSGSFPHFARHPGTSEPLDRALRHVAAHQTVHHSPSTPAVLVLPVA